MIAVLTNERLSVKCRMRNKVVDHIGNVFQSEKEMCKHWGVNYERYQVRKHHGKPIEICLQKGLIRKGNKMAYECYDHLGQKFKNETEMCENWDVLPSTYYVRKNNGWTLQECLIGKTVTDPLGNIFKNDVEMCRHYGVSYSTYVGYIRRGLSMEERLGIIPIINHKTESVVVNDELKIIKNVDMGSTMRGIYFICMLHGAETIMTHDEIVEYYRKNVLKTVA